MFFFFSFAQKNYNIQENDNNNHDTEMEQNNVGREPATAWPITAGPLQIKNYK